MSATIEACELPVPAARPGCLELLGRHGQVLRRLPLPAGEGVLGRDLACDLVLDDPYVCPRHVRLQEVDGRLRIDDLGSVNDLARGVGRPRVSELELASGESVRIGRSVLRYRSAAAPLAPTLVDRVGAEEPQAFGQPWLLALVILAAPLAALLKDYLDTVSRTPGSKLLLEPVVTLLVLLCWAALWAFAGRLLSQRWHIRLHLALVSAAFITFLALDVGSDYLCFALDLDGLREGGMTIGSIVVLGLLLFGHLRLVSLAPSWTLARAAALIALAIFGLTFLSELSDRSEFSTAPPFQASFKAPIFQLAPSSSLDTFFAEAEQLPLRLSERAEEQRQERNR
jgi:pSer/pThr/pTyr-binding forkhead associated (FHA) protein